MMVTDTPLVKGCPLIVHPPFVTAFAASPPAEGLSMNPAFAETHIAARSKTIALRMMDLLV
jgi:hypothetical protein